MVYNYSIGLSGIEEKSAPPIPLVMTYPVIPLIVGAFRTVTFRGKIVMA